MPEVQMCPFNNARCKESRCAIYGNGNCALLSIAYSLRKIEQK